MSAAGDGAVGETVGGAAGAWAACVGSRVLHPWAQEVAPLCMARPPFPGASWPSLSLWGKTLGLSLPSLDLSESACDCRGYSYLFLSCRDNKI